MNDNLKNVFSFIKEALELNNKNIYKVSDYEIHEDLGRFYNKFKDIIDVPDYLDFNINSEQTIFKLKHIKDDKKKKIPEVPSLLKEYIFLDNGNDIISKIDDLEVILDENNLLDLYKEFDENIKQINKYNNLIDTYNSKYMDFYNVYKRINDYEEKIEVIFGQKLMVWTDGQDNKIERYIYEANLDIDVDPINNIITMTINKDKFKGFATDFLNLDVYKIKDSLLFNDYIKEFNSSIVDEEFDVDEEAKKYINYISFENDVMNREARQDEEIKANSSYLFNNCGIIVRNKNVKLWIEDLEKIISSCDNTNFQSPILNMFEVDFSDDSQVDLLLNDKTYISTKEEKVLFPLPSNDEQYKIVDKVKSSNVVLVQGPPGTGKSHTIANLLSHYISDGKKVIVTSEKAKALEVLRNKIPSQIRSLSLSILTSNGVDKDLEYSINNLLKHQEDDSEIEETKNKISQLSNDLNKVFEEKIDVNRKIIDLMSMDTICHKEELKELIDFNNDGNLTLMEIAKWLENNRQYSIVPLNDVENYDYNNAVSFFDKLDDICEDIKNNNYAISSSVPIFESFKTNDIELYIKERIGYENYTIQYPKLVNSIKHSSLSEKLIDSLGSNLDSVSILYKYFDKEFIKSNVKYEPFVSKLRIVKDLINNNKKFIMESEEKIYDYDLEYDNLNNSLNTISDLINLYDDNGNISFLNSLKKILIFKQIENFKINGTLLQKYDINKNVLNNINDILNYHLLIAKIKDKLYQVLEVDLFDILYVKNNQFGKNMDDILRIVDGFVNYETFVSEIDSCLDSVINKNLFYINYSDSDENYIHGVYEDLKYFVTEKNSLKNTNCLINEIRDFYKDYNLQNLNNLLISIENNQLKDYTDYKNLLLSEISIINNYNDLKKLYSRLVGDKKEFIDNYIYKMSFEERKYFKLNIEKIFKYHYVEKFYLLLEEKEKLLPDLFDKRDNLVIEEKNIIESLVATKGWYYQNNNMTSEISVSLNNWLALKKKIGGGTGKNTNIYLRKMREEMDVAKNAIPVWIMPVDKLIEQYPFSNEPPFDILIMDESSQSSIYSISALSRAKKVIIVGDDKQISPTNAFTNLDSFNDLRNKYLKNSKWDLQISKDVSIYDVIQTICGNKKIILTEHFRCLPEIINYSNKEFYNMEINPLKVRGKENTISKPIETIYVPNAVCKKSGTQIINEAEMNRIITLLYDISSNKDYDNKTIGIIALQNNMSKYVQKLSELIMLKFGEKFSKERNIKIGNTYDFQGDERDVIVLSMGVSSLYENGDIYSFRALTTKEFDRSFNVAASRAKEQMILVHSVKLDELNPNCNRYKLLNYCLNYDNERDKKNEELFESNFEKDIYYHLTSLGYLLSPQFKIGNYRIDFVLTNENNQKIAIECDGDKYHGINELENDLKRQSILERCGWKFVRIRASEYYYNREKSIKKVIELINHYLNGNNSISFISNKDSIVYKNNFNKENINIESNEFEDDVKYINDFFKDKIITDENEEKDIENDSENNENYIKNIAPSQFKYMTLFSIGLTRREISEYYGVAYVTVKKTLQALCNKYNKKSAEDFVEEFKNLFSNSDLYKDTITSYYNH